MAEFQEQVLFKGATQAQGFAPEQAPDTTSFLRENMERIDANFAAIKNQQTYAQEAAKNKQKEILDTLSIFSETALKFSQTLGKSYIDSEILEGKAKIRSLGRGRNYGITPEQQEAYNKLLLEGAEDSRNISEAALEADKNGLGRDAVAQIKSLSYYQQIGATQAYLNQMGKQYQPYITRFFERTDQFLAGPNGAKFSPAEAVDNQDPVQMDIALRSASQLFDAEIGIGADFNPSAIAMKPLFEQKDKVDAAIMAQTRLNSVIADSDERVNNARIQWESQGENGDLNALLSEITGTYDSKGNQRNRSDALDLIFDVILPDAIASAGTPAEKEAILNQLTKNSIVVDEKTTVSWRQRFGPNRIEGERGLLSRVDAIERRERAIQNEQLQQRLKDRKKKFFEEMSALKAQNKFPTNRQIEEQIQDAVSDTGMDRTEFSYMLDVMTAEKHVVEQEEERLNFIRANRPGGYLLETDLIGMSVETINKFRPIVNEDALKANRPDQYVTDSTRKIVALARVKAGLKTGDETNPEFEDIRRRALAQDAAYYSSLIDQGVSPEEAQRRTMTQIEKDFKTDKFLKDPVAPSANLKRARTLQKARELMGNNPNINTYVFPDTSAEIEELKKFNQGNGPLPRLYYDLARGQRGQTAFDIANAQFQAAGLGVLRAPRVIGDLTADPAAVAAHKRLINYRYTSNIRSRVNTDTFKYTFNTGTGTRTSTSTSTGQVVPLAGDRGEVLDITYQEMMPRVWNAAKDLPEETRQTTLNLLQSVMVYAPNNLRDSATRETFLLGATADGTLTREKANQIYDAMLTHLN